MVARVRNTTTEIAFYHILKTVLNAPWDHEKNVEFSRLENESVVKA